MFIHKIQVLSLKTFGWTDNKTGTGMSPCFHYLCKAYNCWRWNMGYKLIRFQW